MFVLGHGKQGIAGITEEGYGTARLDSAQMHGEAVADSLPFHGQPRISCCTACTIRILEHGQGEHHHRLFRQPQPLQSVSGTNPTFQGGAQQVGTHPAFLVRSGMQPQQMQRHQLRRVAQGLHSLRTEGATDGNPNGSEKFITCPDCHGNPGQGDSVERRGQCVDDDGLIGTMQLAEHSALHEHLGYGLGHLASQDRLNPRVVRLVLPAGESKHAGVPVFNGDGCIHEGGNSVRQGEQIAGRQTPHRIRSGDSCVPCCEQGPQHGSELCPAGAWSEAKQRDPGLLNSTDYLGVGCSGGADHQPYSTLLAQAPDQQRYGLRVLEANTQNQGMDRKDRFVHGVVNDHAANFIRPAHVALD
ncbi:hypothetical protein PJL18_03408 [Paenarthrobacter nicotinovorans]|nr:hypothetical protein [Paenarthrobacter nicotinovorans]